MGPTEQVRGVWKEERSSSVNERASSFAACQSLCLATKASRPPFDESYTTQQNSLLAPRTHKESCHPPQTDWRIGNKIDISINESKVVASKFARFLNESEVSSCRVGSMKKRRVDDR